MRQSNESFAEILEKAWGNTEDTDVAELWLMIKSGIDSAANELIRKRKTVARRP
jgi:hypothetical protein